MFDHRFNRLEPRESSLAYMQRLIAPLDRTNGWTLAEEAGACGPGPDAAALEPDPLGGADEVLSDVRDYVIEHLGDPEAVLIVDDTGFLKKGVRSAGVQRQYSGTAGRTENCQIGVFLAYATERGRTLIDRALYLPKSWTEDRERCWKAGIDDTVEFATKLQMAEAMVDQAIADEVPFRWLTGDEAYGQSKSWRHRLEEADVFHVMATRCNETVVTRQRLDHRVDELIASLPRQKWERRSCGAGAHGLRVYDWARAEVRPWHREDHRYWVLARRSLTRPGESSYYIAYAPAEATLDHHVQVAGARWAIEECFQSAKQRAARDQLRLRGADPGASGLAAKVVRARIQPKAHPPQPRRSRRGSPLATTVLRGRAIFF